MSRLTSQQLHRVLGATFAIVLAAALFVGMSRSTTSDAAEVHFTVAAGLSEAGSVVATSTSSTTSTSTSTTSSTTTAPTTTAPPTTAAPVTAPPTTAAPVTAPPTTAAPAPVVAAATGACGGNLPPCCVMERESGGNITIVNPSSGAAGKWQFMPATWNGYGGYATASDAPEAVQDAKAAELWAGGAGASHWGGGCW